MKQYCKECGHVCHCLGKGYYVSESFCDSCSCNECKCKPSKPLILTKTKRSKKFETYTICILIIIILTIGLLGCTQNERYPNKMNTIAEKLSQIKL